MKYNTVCMIRGVLFVLLCIEDITYMYLELKIKCFPFSFEKGRRAALVGHMREQGEGGREQE